MADLTESIRRVPRGHVDRRARGARRRVRRPRGRQRAQARGRAERPVRQEPAERREAAHVLENPEIIGAIEKSITAAFKAQGLRLHRLAPSSSSALARRARRTHGQLSGMRGARSSRAWTLCPSCGAPVREVDRVVPSAVRRRRVRPGRSRSPSTALCSSCARATRWGSGSTSTGRGSSSAATRRRDIFLNDITVSRNHAVLDVMPDEVLVSDAGLAQRHVRQRRQRRPGGTAQRRPAAGRPLPDGLPVGGEASERHGTTRVTT